MTYCWALFTKWTSVLTGRSREVSKPRDWTLWLSFRSEFQWSNSGYQIDNRGPSQYKMWSYQYRDPHVKEKTVARPSYLYHGHTEPGKDGLYIETGPSFLFHLRRCGATCPPTAFSEHPIYSVLVMWGKTMIPLYKLWLEGLYGLYVTPDFLCPKKANELNLLRPSDA